MDAMIAEWLVYAATTAVQNGAVVSMALVCLLQYAYQCYQHQQMTTAVHSLEMNLHHVEHDRDIVELENEILGQLALHTRPREAPELMLEQYIPDPGNDLAYFLEYADEGFVVCESRGVSGAVPTDLPEMPQDTSVLILAGNELAAHSAYAQLSLKDRSKVNLLYLIAVELNGERIGLFVTSRLIPVEADFRHQFELARRLMHRVAMHLAQERRLRSQQQSLLILQGRLELRAIADGNHNGRAPLAAAYLQRLWEQTTFDRFAFHAPGLQAGSINAVSFRSGIEGSQDTEDGENRLCWSSLLHCEPHVHSGDDLTVAGFPDSYRLAVTVPVVVNRQVKAVLCASRIGGGRVAKAELEHLCWAAQQLWNALQDSSTANPALSDTTLDPLTGLCDRDAFVKLLTEGVQSAARQETECGLILLDLDQFQRVNDACGHQVGDAVLQIVAGVVRAAADAHSLQTRPACSRYGGDELAVLFPGAGLNLTRRLAEEIRQRIAASPIDCHAKPVPVTLSAGVAAFPESAADGKSLLAAAHAALHDAQQAGTNLVEAATTQASSVPGAPSPASAGLPESITT